MVNLGLDSDTASGQFGDDLGSRLGVTARLNVAAPPNGFGVTGQSRCFSRRDFRLGDQGAKRSPEGVSADVFSEPGSSTSLFDASLGDVLTGVRLSRAGDKDEVRVVAASRRLLGCEVRDQCLSDDF